MSVVVDDSAYRLLGKIREENYQGDECDENDAEDFEIFVVIFKIYGFAEFYRLKILCSLFNSSEKKLVVGIVLYLIGKLKRIKKLVFYLREEFSDKHGSMFVRHFLSETDEIEKRHDEIKTNYCRK
jgi:hypothetical protein